MTSEKWGGRGKGGGFNPRDHRTRDTWTASKLVRKQGVFRQTLGDRGWDLSSEERRGRKKKNLFVRKDRVGGLTLSRKKTTQH